MNLQAFAALLFVGFTSLMEAPCLRKSCRYFRCFITFLRNDKVISVSLWSHRVRCPQNRPVSIACAALPDVLVTACQESHCSVCPHVMCMCVCCLGSQLSSLPYRASLYATYSTDLSPLLCSSTLA